MSKKGAFLRNAPKSFAVEVAAGRMGSDVSGVQKFGYNADIASSYEYVCDAGGTTYAGFLTTADEVRIKVGGNAADTAAGAGAREVTIQGLNASGVLTTEAVATAGASASSKTTAQFIRVFRAWVSASGAYGAANTGLITLETEGGTEVARISAGVGQSLMAIYTVPAGKVAYVTRFYAAADTARTVDYRLFQRQDADTIAAPFTAPRLLGQWTGRTSPIEVRYEVAPGGALPAMTDIYVMAKSDVGGTAGVSAGFDLILENA